MHNYVLEIDGVRHKLVEESGFVCRRCSLRMLCREVLRGALCVSISGESIYMFVKEGGDYEQKDKD